MKKKITHVNPIYFLEHKLYEEADNPSSAYFDIFGRDEGEVDPLACLEEFPHYIATGEFSEVMIYDVYKSDPKIIEGEEYCIIGFTEIDDYIYATFGFQYNVTHDIGEFAAHVAVKKRGCNENEDEILHSDYIFFDTMNDLMGALKTTIRKALFEHDQK